MKKVVFVLSYFTFIPLFIFACIIFFSYLSFEHNKTNFSQNNTKVAYAALPVTHSLLKDKITAKDSRVLAIENFFKRYGGSDLAPFAQLIVDTADKYSLDYRFLPAIAMQESNLCKKAQKKSFNCWGFGIYGDNFKKFKNYPNAIDTVTKTLASDYKDKGLDEPSKIMRKYTPQSNGSWARNVSQFMAELSYKGL